MRQIPKSIPESIVNNAPKLHATFEIGDCAHQGDLIIVRIASVPKSARPRLNHQLAEGTTQGSRHILTPKAKVYDVDRAEAAALILAATKCAVAEAYIGPVFVSPVKPTSRDLDHPEHGPQGFPAGAVCAVVYQRNLDAEERERPVLD